MKKILGDEFHNLFFGHVCLNKYTKEKLITKHKVYEADLEDALGDPYIVVVKSSRQQLSPGGVLYDIYAETEDGRVLFVVGKLFEDGNLSVITSYWANREMISFYRRESEVLKDA